jgi:hypothetical protein
VTANAQSEYVVGGQTLVPGGPGIVISGTTISLAPGATQVVVGSSTAGLGTVILSGLGGSGATETGAETPAYTGPVYTGGVGRVCNGPRFELGGLGMLGLVMGWLWM